MFGCNTHLLKHIKQAILAWLFRQNIILGCYPVFAAISARGEFIVIRHLIVVYFEGVFTASPTSDLQDKFQLLPVQRREVV